MLPAHDMHSLTLVRGIAALRVVSLSSRTILFWRNIELPE